MRNGIWRSRSRKWNYLSFHYRPLGFQILKRCFWRMPIPRNTDGQSETNSVNAESNCLGLLLVCQRLDASFTDTMHNSWVNLIATARSSFRYFRIWKFRSRRLSSGAPRWRQEVKCPRNCIFSEIWWLRPFFQQFWEQQQKFWNITGSHCTVSRQIH